MNKFVYITRAVPGSGKSTFAESIPGAVVCCADDYFTDSDGNYNFDANKLYQAHNSCYDKFVNAIDNEKSHIVVANTNIVLAHAKKYKKYAEEKGYIVFMLVVENHHDGKDVHNVPSDVKEEMRRVLMQNIKLI